MTDDRLDQLLGTTGRDCGCEAAGDYIDAYCDIVARGDRVPARFADFVTHLGNCRACREDTDGLLAALRAEEHRGEG